MSKAMGALGRGVGRLVGYLLCGYALVYAVYYGIWAASASHDELARSWGGPTAVGATLVHWALLAVFGGAGWLLLRYARRRDVPR
ncbi:hypothetical protein [Nocardia transvalensis]|uniref:hypothetical protein n=1 Tax=Nocardia transvalensis TaxID=37333 RepID=UPI001895A36C|nr:hypothetical protein [Nocardia transvalensis]MBF6331505.1 hypothetical protein [Nocardia transvalensis]